MPVRPAASAVQPRRLLGDQRPLRHDHNPTLQRELPVGVGRGEPGLDPKHRGLRRRLSVHPPAVLRWGRLPLRLHRLRPLRLWTPDTRLPRDIEHDDHGPGINDHLPLSPRAPLLPRDVDLDHDHPRLLLRDRLQRLPVEGGRGLGRDPRLGPGRPRLLPRMPLPLPGPGAPRPVRPLPYQLRPTPSANPHDVSTLHRWLRVDLVARLEPLD